MLGVQSVGETRASNPRISPHDDAIRPMAQSCFQQVWESDLTLVASS